MSQVENGAAPYKNRHSKSISLDAYKGIASDLMELNAPVADGFMRVGDMRNDIVIVQKPRERVSNYDQIGNVRVAKFLQLPRLELWRGDTTLQTRREEDVWFVAINDQELADKVARAETNGKKFDDRFVDAFKKEVGRGLTNCLRREKLLNGGRYDAAFGIGYYSLIFYDLLFFPAILASAVSGYANPDTVLKGIGGLAIMQTVHNTINLSWAVANYLQDKLFGPDRYTGIGPIYNEPFVKHSPVELVLPVVPLDRLIRGSLYLGKHGKKLISRS